MAAFGRSNIFAVCFALFLALLSQNAHHDSMLEGVPSGKTRVLDLSYAINDKLVPWPGDEKFFEATVNASVEKNGYFTRSFWMLEHYGTHLDAPAHFPPGKTTVDQIPVKQLFGPAVVIDVRAESGKDADYQLAVARIEDWEKRHGRIPEGAIVLLRTGWASRWPDARKYRNQDDKGKILKTGRVNGFPEFALAGGALAAANQRDFVRFRIEIAVRLCATDGLQILRASRRRARHNVCLRKTPVRRHLPATGGRIFGCAHGT